MSAVLITGGNGRVGRRLTARLAQAGHRVRVADVLPGDDPDVEYLAGDILDYDAMKAATAGIDYVVHLAAIPVENGRAQELFHANVEGTFNVLDAAANNGVSGFVFASTVAVYGFLHPSQPWRPEYFPIDEELPLVAERNYANMKIIGEQFQRSYARSHGMDGIALRLATVMNPGAENWARIVENIDDPETIFVRDLSLREYLWQYVHVEDAAQALELAVGHLAAHPGLGFDAFNIGAADNASTVPSLELVARYFPDTPLVKQPRRFVEEPTTALYGIEKARRVLGFEPRYTWRDLGDTTPA